MSGFRSPLFILGLSSTPAVPSVIGSMTTARAAPSVSLAQTVPSLTLAHTAPTVAITVEPA